MSYVDQYWDSDDRQQLLGDVEITVLDSFWSTPRIESKGKAQFDGADRVQLYWHCQVDEIYQDYDKVIPPSLTIQMSIGDNWVTDEHGVMVENKDDPSTEMLGKGSAKPIQFKGSSFYGKFLGLCSGKYNDGDGYYTQTHVDPMTGPPELLDDGDDVEWNLGEVRAFMARKHANPRNASTWVGTKWRTRGFGFRYSRPPVLSGMKVVPVAFLGVDDAVAAAHTPGQSSQDAASGPADTSGLAVPELVATTLPSDVDTGLVDQLAGLVTTSGSHTEFMRNALNLDGVKSVPEVKAAVMSAAEGPWSVKGKSVADLAAEAGLDEMSGHESNPGLAAEQAADEAS